MTLISLSQFVAFLGAAMLLTLAPGPDNLLVLSLGAARGRRAGIAFGLGCASGCLSHTLLAALGVGALIAASPPAFGALKLIGGLYLIWLGWQAWRSRGATEMAGAGGHESAARLFGKGCLANAINPKVVTFFLAFLPQFVDAGRTDAAAQMLQLGVIFTLQAAVLFGLLGYFAGAAGQLLQRRPRMGLWLDRLAGTIFVGLGLRLIVDR